MRTFAITSILAGLAFSATGLAHADTIGVPVSGSGQFMLSDVMWDFVALGGSATYTMPVMSTPENPINAGSLPWHSLTVDQASNAMLALSETGGGVTIAMPTIKNISTGGAITITDFAIDMVNNQVNVTLVGGNGVGTLTNYTLWRFTQGDALPGTYSPDTHFAGTIGTLNTTSTGLDLISQALGLSNVAKSALTTTLTSFGTIQWDFTTPVPEASTWAMTLLGLGAIGAAVQRRRKQA
ncbi:MAG: PEP-CTERM sorting domain-containing protein [Aquabacterium sp.]